MVCRCGIESYGDNKAHMTRDLLSRRALLASLTALITAPQSVWAREIIDLTWEDLLPETDTSLQQTLRGIVAHEDAPLASQQPASTGVRTDWNGKQVRIPGFVVPIRYEGTGVIAFILVPYVGACIHVPPPPANQLVLVTTERPYDSDGLFEAVNVTGLFSTAATSTDLADIGYTLIADRIEAYD